MLMVDMGARLLCKAIALALTILLAGDSAAQSKFKFFFTADSIICHLVNPRFLTEFRSSIFNEA